MNMLHTVIRVNQTPILLFLKPCIRKIAAILADILAASSHDGKTKNHMIKRTSVTQKFAFDLVQCYRLNVGVMMARAGMCFMHSFRKKKLIIQSKS